MEEEKRSDPLDLHVRKLKTSISTGAVYVLSPRFLSDQSGVATLNPKKEGGQLAAL